MLVNYGNPCPAWPSHTAGDGEPRNGHLYHCKYCDGCKGFFSNGVDCGFSRTPIGLPKFSVGQAVYRNGAICGEPMKVMSCVWDGLFEYQYILRSNYSTRSERHYSKERCIFATLEECERANIEGDLARLVGKIGDYEKKYGKTLSASRVAQLLGAKSSTEPQPQDSNPA